MASGGSFAGNAIRGGGKAPCMALADIDSAGFRTYTLASSQLYFRAETVARQFADCRLLTRLAAAAGICKKLPE
jgi:hypothetical protein